MSLTLLTAGPQTLPVDAGRRGTRSLGVPPGGAADTASLALANALVGNPPDAPALEFALLGPTVRVEVPVRLAVVGAPFTITADAESIPAGRAFSVATGRVVRLGGTPIRVRGYLAVAGGFALPYILGSVTPFKPLRDGAVLPCRATPPAPSFGYPFASLDAGDAVTLRALPGPQAEWFPDAAPFWTCLYRVAATSNRMGVRLLGPPLNRLAGELESEPVDIGAVQVTNDGLPVILGVDGPTIGGYPKIAHVISADRDCLGQLRPGDGVRFERVTPADARRLAAERRAAVREWGVRAGAAAGSGLFGE